jgi:hypothetical protein
MREINEDEAVEQVYQRLVARFPGVPMATVRAVVQDVHASLEGRVRDYVPLLVERGATYRLSGLDAPRTPSLSDRGG